MRHIADRFVVVLDANVLYPFTKRDILLRFFAAGLYRATWSTMILDEWTRSVVANKPDAAESIASQVAAIQEHFGDACNDAGEAHIEGLNLPDPDDRHVLATAIVVNAEQIVTDNLKDFPEDALEPYDLTAVSADDFLVSTFELYEPEALAVLKETRLSYKKPPYTPNEFILLLQSKGLPKLASTLKPFVDSL